MSAPTVFISYSHDSPEHSEHVLQLSDALRSLGIDVELDRYHVRPANGWPYWCEEQLRPEKSTFVLMVCTETYFKRIQNKVSADEGCGVFWEGGIIYDYIYDAKKNNRFIPILFSDGIADFIPVPIRNHTRYRIAAFDLTDDGYQSLYRELTGQPLVTKPHLGKVLELGAALTAYAKPLEARQVKTNFPRADISRIIKYAPAALIGREAEMKLLNDAWAHVQNQEVKRPHVLTFVALGGEGKTSLVAKWAAELAHQEWPGCDAVLAWSFYSQGTREQVAASSDLFLKEALTFFGDAEMANSAQGAFDKGRRLAQLVGERRTLLILDGLEPLQYAPTSPTPGELKDQGIAALVKGLAANSRGLCLVTTRYSLPDLKAYWQTTSPEQELKRLTTAAGVSLLRNLGVTIGSREEFETLVEDVDGHALTLQIMGGFLKKAFHGDIRCRDRVQFEKADAKIQGGHAFRAMAAYVKWMEDESDEARRELAILRLMGLFDRTATGGCIDALLQAPAVPGLTEPLLGLAEEDWSFSLDALESARLLTVNRDAAGTLVSLDAHPLLREYFARQLKRTEWKPEAPAKESPGASPSLALQASIVETSEAWRAAHRRLYEHLCATTLDKPDATLEDLQPLYEAVAHGCHAGLQQKASDEVYFARITRGEEKYAMRRLGAFGSDLGAVACFFETPWSRVSPVLTESDQAWLLNQAAFRLRALGRLTEALEPMRAALEMGVKQENWNSASRRANNLSELELTLGEVSVAVGDAEQSVTYADRSGDAFQRMGKRTTHADALHQAGRPAEAEACFREAEQMQAERQPEYPLLYSLGGFRYCDLLLAEADRAAWQTFLSINFQLSTLNLSDSCRAVEQRAAKTLDWAVNHFNFGLLSIALDHLTLGRAALYEAILNQSSIENPTSTIDQAVSGLRRAGQQQFLPLGLLTRAWLRFVEGKRTGSESAQSDLDEAWEIAERGSMKLYMADIHLYRARLFGRPAVGESGSVGRPATEGVVRAASAEYPWDKNPDGTQRGPKDDLAAARKLIEQCGYWRRKEELEDAENVIL